MGQTVDGLVNPMDLNHFQNGLMPQAGGLEAQPMLEQIHGLGHHVAAGQQNRIVGQQRRPQRLGGGMVLVRPVHQGVKGGGINVDSSGWHGNR